MTDDRRFHNVFHYFRGPSGSGETYDQQLESNATKALINVLEHSDPAVARTFIERFTGDEAPNGRPEFAIEGGPEKLAPGTRSLLLAIASDPTIPTPPAGHTFGGGKGRIDASIYLPGGLLVAMEVKVGDSRSRTAIPPRAKSPLSWSGRPLSSRKSRCIRPKLHHIPEAM